MSGVRSSARRIAVAVPTASIGAEETTERPARLAFVQPVIRLRDASASALFVTVRRVESRPLAHNRMCSFGEGPAMAYDAGMDERELEITYPTDWEYLMTRTSISKKSTRVSPR